MSTYFRSIINSRTSWKPLRMTSKMVSNMASLRSPTEQPVVKTINVTAHSATRIMSTIFHTDFQYLYHHAVLASLVCPPASVAYPSQCQQPSCHFNDHGEIDDGLKHDEQYGWTRHLHNQTHTHTHTTYNPHYVSYHVSLIDCSSIQIWSVSYANSIETHSTMTIVTKLSIANAK